MIKIHNPIRQPLTYSDAIEVTSAGRTLYIAGQVGWDANNIALEGIDAQTRKIFADMERILESAGMTFSNIVKLVTYLVAPETLAQYSTVRQEMLQGVKPAGTLVYVKQLILPDLLVEVEAIAVADQ
jgi:enamine deaminase RidA (YjgF/YER057c/UK114 family)